MLFIEITKIKFTGGHIKIMLVIEITKIKVTGGHIEFMLIIEMAKIEIKRRLYWIYGQNKINPTPYWHYAYYRDG